MANLTLSIEDDLLKQSRLAASPQRRKRTIEWNFTTMFQNLRVDVLGPTNARTGPAPAMTDQENLTEIPGSR